MKNLDEVTIELRSIRAELRKLSEQLRPVSKCLSPAAAAKQLGIGLTKMRQLITSGHVKTVLLGKRRMVSLSEIDRVASLSEKRATKAKHVAAQDWSALRAAIRRG